MHRKLPIFYSAVLLTAVNLLLRLVSTVFQICISSRIGAEGVGLLQLILSVGMLAMTAGTAGIRTAAMYLTAEELGKKREYNIPWVLHSCFLYSILCSGTIAILLYGYAEPIAVRWIGTSLASGAIRLLAFALPVNCLCGVMSGYFTAAGRIGTLAAVEASEQIFSITATLVLLFGWAGDSVERACQAVVLGGLLSACTSLILLSILKYMEHPIIGSRISLKSRIRDTAVPLALADDLKSGISTAENLMVPKRMGLCPKIHNPLAVFGIISGMVFPVLMFPASILFGLADLLIPELSRCNAAGSRKRIEYLAMRSLRMALIYGAFSGGILYLTGPQLCVALYKNSGAGKYLSCFALLAPMLYCDAITDAMTKGLGQQKACVRYNILTSSMDVLFLYLLLPHYGILGYFISFFVTHLLNFSLSLRRLLKITGKVLKIRIIGKILFSMGLSLLIVSVVSGVSARCMSYCIIFTCLLTLLQVVSMEDYLWVKNLIHKK